MAQNMFLFPLDIMGGDFTLPAGQGLRVAAASARKGVLMSIGKYNSECYYDPTAYAALTAVENEERAVKAYRPIVYICSPYSGDVEVNIANARRYCRFAVDAAYIPIAPHFLFPQFLNDSDRLERMLGLHCGNALMSKCVEVWVFGKTISNGMAEEIEYARRKEYTIKYFCDEIKEVKD